MRILTPTASFLPAHRNPPFFPSCGAILLGLFLIMPPAGTGSTISAQPVIIGSKRFTESYVLAEIAKRAIATMGMPVELRPGMGGTIILWEALNGGSITCYPEYTGTIQEVILKSNLKAAGGGPADLEFLRRQLRAYGIGITGKLGFDNTYAVALRRSRAEQLGIHKISDLKEHEDLVVGLSPEFLGRKDGWRPLCARYGLQMRNVRGMDHTLAYLALAKGEIDVTDAYSTDARIAQDHLIVLRDDQGFFPQYEAVFLYRLDADPRVLKALRTLEGTLDEQKMTRLNAMAERTRDYAKAAALYFHQPSRSSQSLAVDLVHWTGRHLLLVGLSLAASILLGLPLGIWASRPGWVSEIVLGASGIIQTIPSLALLALLVSIPFLGISPLTAVIALFLYGLLPIVRNTATGIQDISKPIRESAEVLGLEPRARLVKISLPLASRSILAGIKTSAVINVGTATLAALIGAGGLGEPIISGLNLNDRATILEGAVPAAILALVVQVGFGLLDRLLIPKGLQLNAAER